MRDVSRRFRPCAQCWTLQRCQVLTMEGCVCRERLPFRGRARLGRGGRVVYDRCSAAVSGMHGAFSESGGIYGGTNRGDGLDDYPLERPGDRASAIWKHMRAGDLTNNNGNSDVRRCDWNYLGSMSTQDMRGGGGEGGMQRGQGGMGGDWRKRSLSEISGMFGMANGLQKHRYAGSCVGSGSKMFNSVDSSIRPETAEFIKKARWADKLRKADEGETLSEASTRLDA